MTDHQFAGSSPDPAPPHPREFAHHYRQVGGVGIVAAVLIGFATVASAVDTWFDWNRYQLARDYVAGDRSVTENDLDAADQLTTATVWGYVIALLAAGIVFLVWLWRARQNAEAVFCTGAPHRKGPGWVVGSWICPIVNWWFPFMIVDDIYRASRPDNPTDLTDLRAAPGSWLIGAWWALWLVGTIVNWIIVRVLRGEISVDMLRSIAVWDTIDTVMMAGSAVLIITIMRKISGWQSPRRFAHPAG